MKRCQAIPPRSSSPSFNHAWTPPPSPWSLLSTVHNPGIKFFRKSIYPSLSLSIYIYTQMCVCTYIHIYIYAYIYIYARTIEAYRTANHPQTPMPSPKILAVSSQELLPMYTADVLCKTAFGQELRMLETRASSQHPEKHQLLLREMDSRSLFDCYSVIHSSQV